MITSTAPRRRRYGAIDAYCWGDNGYGQLGNGESDPASLSAIPLRIMRPLDR